MAVVELFRSLIASLRIVSFNEELLLTSFFDPMYFLFSRMLKMLKLLVGLHMNKLNYYTVYCISDYLSELLEIMVSLLVVMNDYCFRVRFYYYGQHLYTFD